jgi:peptidoglycan/LPS O-acetylase OafA/YrhL
MFFAVSGFCIAAAARSTIRRGDSWAEFLFRRAWRVYPAYWAAIVVVAATPFLIELTSSLKSGHYTPPSGVGIHNGYMNYGVGDWVRVASLTQVFTPPLNSNEANPARKFETLNTSYWTLAIEVQFYAAVGLALIWPRRFYAIMVGLTVVAIPLVFVPGSGLWGLFLPYWPIFAVGVLVFWLLERGWVPSKLFGPRAAYYCGAAALGLVILLVVYLLNDRAIVPHVYACLFGLFLWIAEGFDRPVVQRVLASRWVFARVLTGPFVALGAMSFSLYLLHNRLQFLSHQFVRQVIPTDSVVFHVGVIGLTIAICYAFHRMCGRLFADEKRKASTLVPSSAGQKAADRSGDPRRDQPTGEQTAPHRPEGVSRPADRPKPEYTPELEPVEPQPLGAGVPVGQLARWAAGNKVHVGPEQVGS